MTGNIDHMFDQSLGQLSDLLDSDRVIGDAIETPYGTLIPLFSTGFGFGGGQGGDDAGASGGGAGAGGGIKPVSVVIISEDGVRVHRLTESDAIERLAEAAGRAVDRVGDRFGGRRESLEPGPQAHGLSSTEEATSEVDADTAP